MNPIKKIRLFIRVQMYEIRFIREKLFVDGNYFTFFLRKSRFLFD
jgi:hypothetical protein